MKTEIKDHPMLMSGPMVLATLEGRKTMTRRIIKPQPLVSSSSKILGEPRPHSLMLAREIPLWLTPQEFADEYAPYQPGDRLWIKEDYIIHRCCDKQKTVEGYYYADAKYFQGIELTDREWALFNARKYPFRKTPGRFMYKSLARIWREVVSTPPERVQDATLSDILREGAPKGYPNIGEWWIGLWDSINGAGAWKRNGWVFAISHKEIN